MHCGVFICRKHTLNIFTVALLILAASGSRLVPSIEPKNNNTNNSRARMSISRITKTLVVAGASLIHVLIHW